MAKTKKSEEIVPIDRRDSSDRRDLQDRRQREFSVGIERRGEGRRKTPRRRQIDPTTCERDYTGDEIEFMHTLDEYKRTSGRMFPTCSEILEVLRNMGYVRVAKTGVTAIGFGNESAEPETSDFASDLETDTTVA